MVAGVCAQAPGSAAETVSLRPVFSSVTVFTVQLLVVLRAICGVQELATHFYRIPPRYKHDRPRSYATRKTSDFVKSYLPHLKHILWYLYPPAIRSSAAYTDFTHFGHFGCSMATKGILRMMGRRLLRQTTV